MTEGERKMKWEGKAGSHPRDIDGKKDSKEPRKES